MTILTRNAARLSSFNPEKRTVDAVLATETPVRRRSNGSEYDEVLAVSRDAIDTSRIDGMSVLDSHDNFGLDSRIGSVVTGSLRFVGTEALVTIKLSRNAKGEQVFRDLEDGHTLSVSVGYSISQTETVEAARGGISTVRATRWQPQELSVVSVPADPKAKTRSQEEIDMPRPANRSYLTPKPELEEPEEFRALNESANRIMSVREARGFAIELAENAKAARYLPELQQRIKRGMTEADVRNALLNVMVAEQEKAPTFPHTETRMDNDGSDRELKARQDALFARMTGHAPEGEARQFMNDTLLDHARGMIQAQGVDARSMSREQIFGYRARSYGQHTTSDFPLLLLGAGERTLQGAYQAAQSPLKTLLSRASQAQDFRAKSKLKISDAGLLEKVNESGEITATTRSETSESFSLDTYARIFALSFQALINDDLSAFSDWATQAGQMAALTENKVLLDLILSGSGAGPVMKETSKRLFHADHGNLASAGTALDETSLAAAILAFRKQKGLGGYRAAIAPKYLLIGPELEITAQKLLAAITPATTATATPEAIKSLIPVVEPNMDGKGWYLFADPASAPVFEHAHLAGHEGVQLSTREGFERLGTEYRAVLHFGAGAIDYRGAYRNPGA